MHLNSLEGGLLSLLVLSILLSLVLSGTRLANLSRTICKLLVRRAKVLRLLGELTAEDLESLIEATRLQVGPLMDPVALRGSSSPVQSRRSASEPIFQGPYPSRTEARESPVIIGPSVLTMDQEGLLYHS